MNIAQAKKDTHDLTNRLRVLSANDEGRTLEDVLPLLSDLADVGDSIEAALAAHNDYYDYDCEPAPM